MMILIIDGTKGVQTQTAECIMIGEILSKPLLIILNKIDLFPEGEREEKIIKCKSKLKSIFSKTKFGGEVAILPMICVGDSPLINTYEQNFLQQILLMTVPTEVDTQGEFVYAVDHCFALKGKGTILTGTVLNGSIRIGEHIQIPSIGQDVRKVKGVQIYRKNVEGARKGDRAALCVVGLDPKLLERGLVCSPGGLLGVTRFVALVNKIKYFKYSLNSNSTILF